jgi:hypothetical protein
MKHTMVINFFTFCPIGHPDVKSNYVLPTPCYGQAPITLAPPPTAISWESFYLRQFPLREFPPSLEERVQKKNQWRGRGRAARGRTNACTICVTTDFRQPHECLLLHYALWAQNWFLIWPNWLLFWGRCCRRAHQAHTKRDVGRPPSSPPRHERGRGVCSVDICKLLKTGWQHSSNAERNCSPLSIVGTWLPARWIYINACDVTVSIVILRTHARCKETAARGRVGRFKSIARRRKVHLKKSAAQNFPPCAELFDCRRERARKICAAPIYME